MGAPTTPTLVSLVADRVLTSDEACAAGRAALLAIPIGEGCPFLRDAIDVGGRVTHHALAVMAYIPIADVVAPDDEDVRFVRLCHAPLLWLTCALQIARSVDVSFPLRRYTRRN